VGIPIIRICDSNGQKWFTAAVLFRLRPCNWMLTSNVLAMNAAASPMACFDSHFFPRSSITLEQLPRVFQINQIIAFRMNDEKWHSTPRRNLLRDHLSDIKMRCAEAAREWQSLQCFFEEDWQRPKRGIDDGGPDERVIANCKKGAPAPIERPQSVKNGEGCGNVIAFEPTERNGFFPADSAAAEVEARGGAAGEVRPSRPAWSD
jgi:hypothetical protein